MVTSIGIPASIIRGLIEHARAELPNEACGIISGTADPDAGGTPVRWYPTRNEYSSPLRYNIHPQDLVRVFTEVDPTDGVFWAIVHSHTHTPAIPSPTDIGLSVNWPDALYILVSLATDEPDVRAWRIVDGEVHEVTLEVTE